MTQMWLTRRYAALLILAALQFVWFVSGTQTVSAQEGETLFLPMLSAPGSPDGGEQTSAELIDAALARKEIDAETALVYKVFASFGDSRLPAKYRGSGDEFDTILLRQVVSQYATLSGQAQATLAPFF